MRALAFPALLLAIAVSQPAYSQYDFDDFLKAVESGQQKTGTLNSPRLAQVPSAIEELPAPKPTLPGPIELEPSGLSSTADAPSLSEQSAKEVTPTPSPASPQNQRDPGPYQPIPLEAPPQPQSLVMPSPTLPSPINFDEVFAQQDVGLSCQDDHVASRRGARGCSGSGCESCASGCRSCAVMAHYPVNLPAPSTLRGYFNASPCVANVWDGYACDAAKECQRTQQQIQSGHSRQASSCAGCQSGRH